MQVITEPDERYEEYCASSDFIREHIFPGGHLPSMGAMVEAARPTQLQARSLSSPAVPDTLTCSQEDSASGLDLTMRRLASTHRTFRTVLWSTPQPPCCNSCFGFDASLRHLRCCPTQLTAEG